jgi:uncharacterized protein YciI
VTAVPPIRRQIVVPADPARAFDAFTGSIGAWWPLAELSVNGAGATVAFVNGEIVEQSPDGRRAVWGELLRWERGVAVAFTWHPGGSPERASYVEVTFEPASSETVVTLEHRGWDVFDDPAVARAEYDQGWPQVLDQYHDHVRDSIEGETWVALLHRPGPAAPQSGTVFDDPRFGEHVAFLNRLRAAGYLVAAGPFGDVPGEGMTIVRLPGTDRLAQAIRLATEDDASVAGGFFTVTVRPWQVMFEGDERPGAVPSHESTR